MPKIATTSPSNSYFPTAKDLGIAMDSKSIEQAITFGGIIGFLLLLALFFPRKRSPKIASARWATPKERAAANKVGLETALQGSITNPTLWISEPIGESYPRLVDLAKSLGITYFNQTNRSIVIAGTGGSGKTRTIIDPFIKSAIEQGIPIILFDAKHPTQASHIVPYARKCGYSISIFAPGESFPESDAFNFFDAFKNVDDPSVYALQICATIRKNSIEKGAKSDPFFDENGASIAAGAMVLAQHISDKLNRPDLANMLFANSILDLPDLAQQIEAAKTTLPLSVYNLFKAYIHTGDGKGKNKTQGSLVATAQQIISRFALRALIPSCCQQGSFPGFDRNEPLKLEGKQLCVLGLDQAAKNVIAPILAAAIEQIGSYNLNNKLRRRTPLLFALDEFPALNLPVVKDWQAEKRSMGAMLLLGVQTPSQFDDVYGPGSSKGFLARASTHCFLNPGDWEAAESISKSLGEEEIKINSRGSSHSRGKSPSSSRSSNEQVQKRRLISAEDIMQLSEGDCIIRTPIVRSVGGKFADAKQRIPYRKRFEVNNEAIDLEEKESEAIYSKMREAVARSKPKTNSEDAIRSMVNEHYEILAKFLPLIPGDGELESAPPKRGVRLHQVVDKVRHNGLSLPNLPDREIEIPDHFSDNLTIEECLELLTKEGINYYEPARF
jgi:type IV secretion system protein VirD4